MEVLAVASYTPREKLVPRLLCIIWIPFGLSLLIVFLRLFARYMRATRLGLDDVCIVLALVSHHRSERYQILTS